MTNLINDKSTNHAYIIILVIIFSSITKITYFTFVQIAKSKKLKQALNLLYRFGFKDFFFA